MSRYISQTPGLPHHPVGHSVEEIIENAISEAIHHKGIKFVSAGREDVDVLMLGRGRPFFIELLNPSFGIITKEEIIKISKAINLNQKHVRVNDLQEIDRDGLRFIKEGEQERRKIYSALCYIHEPFASDELAKRIESLAEIRNLEIRQRTPLRVLSSRSLSTRCRMIYEVEVTQIDYTDFHRFKLKLTTQAGTYIKEFVNGDLGRTDPSISSLLGYECDNIQLDVLEICLDYPPFISGLTETSD